MLGELNRAEATPRENHSSQGSDASPHDTREQSPAARSPTQLDCCSAVLATKREDAVPALKSYSTLWEGKATQKPVSHLPLQLHPLPPFGLKWILFYPGPFLIPWELSPGQPGESTRPEGLSKAFSFPSLTKSQESQQTAALF